MSLTVKTDDVTKGRKDVDPHGRLRAVQELKNSFKSDRAIRAAIEGVGISAGTVFPLIIAGGAIILFFAPKWGDCLIEGVYWRQFCVHA